MATLASGDRYIGANLRKARESRGWSRETLSRRTIKAGSPVSVATIARTELYGHEPTVAILVSLADALDLTLSDLVCESLPAPDGTAA